MFLDANTFHPAERTWHQSVLGNLRLIDKWRPKRAYMIHYSGYEDREYPQEPVHGPLASEQFRAELRRVAGGRDIQAARARNDPGRQRAVARVINYGTNNPAPARKALSLATRPGDPSRSKKTGRM